VLPPPPGHDVDYRWSLANERTFLAWIRTSLSLVAAAVAIVQLVPPFPHMDLRRLLGAFLAATAAATALLAYTRWAATERAMRQARPRPGARGLVLVSGALAVLAVVVLALVVGARR
jgi:putative membrane protein